MTPYAREPLRLHGTIPVFSETNEYINNYDQIAGDHLESMQMHGTNPWYPEDLWKATEQGTIALIKKYARPGQSILDVGVGLGRLLGPLPELDRYGMDISLNYLHMAQSKGINVCQSMIEDMPYREHLFDIITCTDVLEHVLDLNFCTNKILSVLKPGGILIVRVPNREDMSAYLSPNVKYKFVHLRSFDESNLRLFFTKIMNCDILEVGPGVHVPAADKLKIQVPVPRFNGCFRIPLGVIRKVNRPVYDVMCKLLYHPFTLNVVLRKH